MTTDNFCFYLQNRLIQTSQTGGQWYSDTSPFSIPLSILNFQFESGFCGRGELYEADRAAPQKSYEEDEEGKLVPHRFRLDRSLDEKNYCSIQNGISYIQMIISVRV
jgi:hypothetical protein